jgi:heat shock protein HslJ
MKKYCLFITISACLLANCGSQQKTNSTNNLDSNTNQQVNIENKNAQKDLSFVNTKWILKSVDGKEIATLKNPACIMFKDDDSFSGYSGCNGFSGSYYLSGDILKLSNTIATQKGCFPENPEKLFFDVMSRTDACVVIGKKLIFTQMSKEIAVFESTEE